MFSFRGDAHKFYLRIKNSVNKKQSVSSLKEIAEIKEIKSFYQELSVTDLTNIRYRMIKEHNGSGIIPLIFGSLPWLGFIFSKQLQTLLFIDGAYLWAWFLIGYSLILSIGLILHYREKAWTSIHLELLDDVINEKQKHSGKN